MAEKISWSLNVQIPGGPKLASSQNVDVDAYDKIVAVVPAGATDHPVNVQPGVAADVKFLSITANRYTDLLYKAQDGSGPAANDVPFDAPQLFLGSGAVGLLEKDPTQLLFTNNHATEDVTVQILVGRNI